MFTEDDAPIIESGKMLILIDDRAPYDADYQSRKRRKFSVQVLDMRHHQDKEWNQLIEGFESSEAAREYATRRMRASVEAARGESDSETRQRWHDWGEDCGVVNGTYRGSEHLDFYIANVATWEECNYMALEPK